MGCERYYGVIVLDMKDRCIASCFLRLVLRAGGIDEYAWHGSGLLGGCRIGHITFFIISSIFSCYP